VSANSYTTADLVDNVVLIGHIPLSNSTFTAAEIIKLANRELQTSLIKQILSVRGGYYLTYLDYVINAAGQYPIPPDAIAGALANIELVQDTTIIPVNQLEESEQYSTISPSSTSYGFFIKGNTIQILPTPNIGTARIWYLRRPNALVATSAASQVAGITGAVLTVSSLPSTLIVGQSIDACQDQPTFDMLGTREITDITSLNVTIDSAISDLVVGDWIAVHNQTPVPQIPVEFRPLLEQRVVVKIYELQGYLDKMKAAQGKLTEIEKDMYALITPRVQSQTKVIMPVNGGFLSGGRGRGNFPAGRNG